MSTGHWRVRPAELERMLASVKKAGLHVTAVEVTADAIKISVGETNE